jgi:hypothetical protein
MTAPRLHEQNPIGRKALLKMGTPSPYLWDLSLSRQNGSLQGRLTPPRHSGRWVGAPVASLRSRTFRPGRVSISSRAGPDQRNRKSLA